MNKIAKIRYYYKNDRPYLIHKIREKLIKYPILYNISRFCYKVARGIKNIIFMSKKYRELKYQAYDLQLQLQNKDNEENNLANQIESYTVTNEALKDELEQVRMQSATTEQGLKDELQQSNSQIDDAEQILFENINTVYYYHGGSGNHGCEALVRTITEICEFPREKLSLFSFRKQEDERYKLTDIIGYIKRSKLDGEEIPNVDFKEDVVALSIGGDNYCYSGATPLLAKYNSKFNNQNAKTALIGCSIEPELLTNQEVLDDLNKFSLIVARESITYNALLEAGITRNTHLVPDSAFTLRKIERPLPDNFVEGNTIGINVSNLIQSYDAGESISYKNFYNIIKYLVHETSYSIALIPHVVQSFNDDMETIKKLYEEFKDNNRVILIEERNCMELKGYISRCKMFVAARTHATIAAYTSYVPTLVVGYSVKSRGIARDIFGDEKNHVIAVQDFTTDMDLVNAFKWLEENYSNIKKHLETVMPEYIKDCYKIKKLIEDVRKNGEPIRYLDKDPLVTIITPCYNSEGYLQRFLDSILNQEYKKIELILINDGSSDNTEQIIKKNEKQFVNQGMKLVYHKQKNRGVGAAINAGLKLVTGEFFCWGDSDDFYDKEYVKVHVDYFRENPNCNILRSDRYFINDEKISETKIRKDFPKSSDGNSKLYTKKLFFNAILEKNFHFGTGSATIRTKAFDEVAKREIYESRVGQNWQILLPMFYHYDSSYIDKPLYYVVERRESVSRSNISDSKKFFKRYDEYQRILIYVIKSMNLKEEKYLLELIKQKYIIFKLEYAKAVQDTLSIEKLSKDFEKYVKNDNIYEKEINKIINLQDE